MTANFDKNPLDVARTAKLPKLPSRPVKTTKLPPPFKLGQIIPTPKTIQKQPETRVIVVDSYLPDFQETLNDLKHELTERKHELLSLNRSRRDSLSHYLSLRLQDETKSALPLDHWLSERATKKEREILDQYFDRVVQFYLAKTLLLKSWNDRGKRGLQKNDLSEPSHAIAVTLRPHTPIDHGTWNFTQSFFSWFIPSKLAQEKIKALLDSVDLSNHSSNFLRESVFNRHKEASTPFQASFFSFLESVSPAPKKQNAFVFSPDLRLHTLPESLFKNCTWFGFEKSLTSFLISEICSLWDGPKAPYLKEEGFGLTAFQRPQLDLGSALFSKESSSRLSEIDCAHASFLFENADKTTLGEKSSFSFEFKKEIENHSYFRSFKKTKDFSLSLAQALVCISKLKPGGIFFWSRALPLGDGNETQDGLKLLLQNAKLLCEIHFESLTAEFPKTQELFPNHLYVFEKEADFETIRNHHPIYVKLEGRLRSSLESELLFKDLLTAVRNSENPPVTRTSYRISMHQSPTPQSEWLASWNSFSGNVKLTEIEKLREVSQVLGTLATVKALPKSKSSDLSLPFLPPPRDLSLSRTLYFAHEFENQKNRLKLLSQPESSSEHSLFRIVFSDERSVKLIATYLTSEFVKNYFDETVERKNGKWNLREGNWLKLPIPVKLTSTPASTKQKQEGTPFQSLTEFLKKEESLSDLDSLGALSFYLNEFEKNKQSLSRFSNSDGETNWKEVLRTLDPAQLTTLLTHPLIRYQKLFPMHLSFVKISEAKKEHRTIVLTTQLGPSLSLEFDEPILYEIFIAQLKELTSPTLSEIVSHVVLPRNAKFAKECADSLFSFETTERNQKRKLDQLYLSRLNSLLGFGTLKH